MVAYYKHPKFNALRHLLIPVFSLLANLACMAFYLVDPFLGYGTKKEPPLALAIAALWGTYGAIYFLWTGRNTGRKVLMETRTSTT